MAGRVEPEQQAPVPLSAAPMGTGARAPGVTDTARIAVLAASLLCFAGLIAVIIVVAARRRKTASEEE